MTELESKFVSRRRPSMESTDGLQHPVLPSRPNKATSPPLSPESTIVAPHTPSPTPQAPLPKIERTGELGLQITAKLKLLEEKEWENEQLLMKLHASEQKREAALDRLTEVMSNSSVVASIHSQYNKVGNFPGAQKFDEQALITHMRDSHYGITAKDRRWRLRMYPNCFIASELVDWLISTGWANTREDATAIGQQLSTNGAIYNVTTKDRAFEDGFYFHRFKELAPVRVKLNWTFTPLKNFSVALSSRLAQKVEHAADESERLHYLKELRRNVLYFALKNNKGWSHRRRTKHGVDTYTMKRTGLDANKQEMSSRIVKTVGIVPVPCSQFVSELLDFRTRRRWEPLFAEGRVISRLGPTTRIIHRSSISPLKSIWPRDVCVLQDSFTEKNERTIAPRFSQVLLSKNSQEMARRGSFSRERLDSDLQDLDDETCCVYEISVVHDQVPSMNGFVRADILLLAHVLRPVPHDPSSSELVIISQVDFQGSAPEWFVDGWVGQQSLENFGKNKPHIETHVPVPSPAEQEDVDYSYYPGFDGASSSSHRAHTQLETKRGYFASPAPDGDSVIGHEPSSDEEDSSPVQVGTSDFETLAVVGQGAFSKIFQVRQKGTNKLYAMKVLSKKDVLKTKQEHHVMTERHILMQMNHPYVVKLHYSFQSTTQLYLVMSWAAGGDLFTSLRRQGLSEQVACFYTAELVCALRSLHAQGVVHRDVKPENILLNSDGHVLLTDFGLSKENMTTNDRTFSLSGTSEYVSPEMLLNTGHGMAVDWWQLGIVLHEMLSGKHPFYSSNTYHMHQNIIYKQPVFDSHVSTEAKSLLRGFLRKDPSRRLGTNFKDRDIEKHPFFKKHQINWQRIALKQVEPACKPTLLHPGDTCHFESVYTNQKPPRELSPDKFSLSRAKLHSKLGGEEGLCSPENSVSRCDTISRKPSGCTSPTARDGANHAAQTQNGTGTAEHGEGGLGLEALHLENHSDQSAILVEDLARESTQGTVSRSQSAVSRVGGEEVDSVRSASDIVVLRVAGSDTGRSKSDSRGSSISSSGNSAGSSDNSGGGDGSNGTSSSSSSSSCRRSESDVSRGNGDGSHGRSESSGNGSSSSSSNSSNSSSSSNGSSNGSSSSSSSGSTTPGNSRSCSGSGSNSGGWSSSTSTGGAGDNSNHSCRTPSNSKTHESKGSMSPMSQPKVQPTADGMFPNWDYVTTPRSRARERPPAEQFPPPLLTMSKPVEIPKRTPEMTIRAASSVSRGAALIDRAVGSYTGDRPLSFVDLVNPVAVHTPSPRVRNDEPSTVVSSSRANANDYYAKYNRDVFPEEEESSLQAEESSFQSLHRTGQEESFLRSFSQGDDYSADT